MIVALLNQKGGGVGALALRQAGEWCLFPPKRGRGR